MSKIVNHVSKNVSHAANKIRNIFVKVQYIFVFTFFLQIIGGNIMYRKQIQNWVKLTPHLNPGQIGKHDTDTW